MSLIQKNQFWLVLLAILSAQPVYAESNFCGFQCSVNQLPKTVETFNAIYSPNQKAQICNADLIDLGKDQDSDPVVGARKLMAMTYGSCAVLKKPVLKQNENLDEAAVAFDVELKQYSADRSKILKTHPYLAERMGASCSDYSVCTTKKRSELSACELYACMSLSHAPVYQPGSRADDHNGVYSIFNKVRKGETGALGLDDAAFISGAFAIKGVRILPDQNMNLAQKRRGGFSNAEFWALGATDSKGKNLDCFERVQSRGVTAPDKPGISPGDLIVGYQSHVSMIDTVGDDPFGIDALVKKGKSDDLEISLNEMMNEKGIAGSNMISQYNFDLLKQTKLDAVLNGKSRLSPNLQIEYLNQMSNAACELLLRKPEDYRVTIIHSSPHHGGVGVQREKIFPGLGSAEELSSQGAIFRMKVLADCDQTLRASWAARATNDEIKLHLTERSKLVAALENLEARGKSARILHHNPSFDGCRSGTGERPLIEASDCVRCCDTQSSYDALVPGEKQWEQTR